MIHPVLQHALQFFLRIGDQVVILMPVTGFLGFAFIHSGSP